MGIVVKTRKLLWGKSASRCSFHNCRRELVMDETETDDPSIIGEECHIIAKKDDGARGNIDFPEDQRDLYDNLILMCNIHHKVIDDQENLYTVEKLKEMKKNHEEWVRNSLNIDEKKIKDELLYSSYIDELVKKANFDKWEGWTSWLLGAGEPSIRKKKLQELEELKDWMYKRIMPNTYIELENSFENFGRVLQDLINTFNLYSIERGESFETEKFYKINQWDTELYDKLFKEFRFHVLLINDLVLELTRAANYVCDQVRRYLLSDFRLKEGILVVTTGPHIDFSYKTYKASYVAEQRTGIPYKNLNQFKEERQKRDYCFGIGANVEESLKLGMEY